MLTYNLSSVNNYSPLFVNITNIVMLKKETIKRRGGRGGARGRTIGGRLWGCSLLVARGMRLRKIPSFSSFIFFLKKGGSDGENLRTLSLRTENYFITRVAREES